MKRLLRISLDLALLSFAPVLSWLLLGLLVDPELINTFTLTYPIQFVFYIIKAIFATGANISKTRDQNPNAVLSALLLGLLVATPIFGFILINLDSYITFMNMDPATYGIFAAYSVLQLFLCTIFSLLLEKLYYEGKNRLANRCSLIFNSINLFFLIGTAILTTNQLIIVFSALIPLALFTVYVCAKSTHHFRFRLNFLRCIKYNSTELFSNLAFLLIFLFGLSNAVSYGPEFATALTFIALITDTQWDAAESVTTAAMIDISKRRFNYRAHFRNAYKLLFLLFLTSVFMFIILYPFYRPDLSLTLLYLIFELINYAFWPTYRLKICYLQLEWSAFGTTVSKFSASALRFACSFLATPFCTGIGQASASLLQVAVFGLIFRRHFRINHTGKVTKRRRRRQRSLHRSPALNWLPISTDKN